MRFIVVYGSVRSDRQGIRAARGVLKALEAREHEVDFFDPLVLQLPLLDRMYKEYPKGKAPQVLESMASKIRASDAVVVVSGEYNRSIPPALSNLVDHFLEEWFWRPSGIVCYSSGIFGGVRAAVQLRSMLAELGMPAIPSDLPVPKVSSAFDENGEPSDPEGWRKRSGRFLDELEWYARALGRERGQGTPY